MYGLKPVPFVPTSIPMGLKPVPFVLASMPMGLKPVPFVPASMPMGRLKPVPFRRVVTLPRVKTNGSLRG